MKIQTRHRLKGLAAKLFPDPFARLDANKKQLIDFACELGMASFADLGAVWNVDAGYTFYTMERHKGSTGVIVDTDLTPAVLERQKEYRDLKSSRETLDSLPFATRWTTWMECSSSILYYTR